ncbi:dedicator of cytokinesis protein 1 isoform X1 [Episyrphus balteatus]|uniref:dedicator of cytokinesis protein 1 isoform X1 n=1 Tax=Episyrphus balteatus TaxID=286459 RepID=UPI002485DA29|nr:dedicator of cytokinesis protein 1 isoform X1 [Episyrphus balteatus]
MTVWLDTDDQHRFGIAKDNFEEEDKPHRLTLDVGDSVVILKELTQWYYGYNTKRKDKRGIFPKGYIQTVEWVYIKGDYYIKRSEIVEETTKVILEWGRLLKGYYLNCHPDFTAIKRKMFELIHLRALLISGNLPADEMRKVKLLATSQIDTGNCLLGLDMVVRDESGNMLDTNATCTTELYDHHLNAVDRIRRANNPHAKHRTSRTMNKYSHNVLLTVHAFVCKFQEDSDLLFTLYNGETHKPITENYVVRWGRLGIARDIDQFDNIRVLFTDLSTNDLNISMLYLVCYAVRIGSMEMKEKDRDKEKDKDKRSSLTSTRLSSASKKSSQLSINSNSSSGNSIDHMRRPFGVACKDLTPIIGKPDDFKRNLDLPFIMCEKDNFDTTLKKLVANKDIGKIDSKVAVSIEVLQGDIKQIKEEFPHLVHGKVPFARKMGFPEVILPGDVRNDLYLSLMGAEFSRSAKSSEKNVEVTVYVCNERGEVVPGVMSIGAGHGPVDEYKSVVYYHDDKPKWLETFKIHVPIDEFKQCHLKFLYKHRSSNEQKDRNEKPFGLSYIKLMQDNGTTITQGQHNLIVYKIDHKKFDKNVIISYMDLPSTVSEIPSGTKPSTLGLTLLSKDSVSIGVNLCSTKLTQSVSLLGLLNWSAHKESLEDSLKALATVPGEEVVKFLQDILDALFNILVENDNPERYDNLVFMSIIHLVETVSDLKYQHFLSVLDVYINESFSATLAYNKLIDVLQNHIREAINAGTSNNYEADEEKAEVRRLYKTTKFLHYVMKFIIRSRMLFAALNDNSNLKDFENKLEELLIMFIDMIDCPTDLLKSEGALLKNLHVIATDLLQVYDKVELSNSIVKILMKFPPGRLTQSKMVCIKDFVDSKLFHYPECRAILLPVFCKHIKDRLESGEEGDCKSDIWQQEKNLTKAAKVLGQLKSQLHTRETTAKLKVNECINIMNNILKLLFRDDIGPTEEDIKDVMLILLRTVIKTSQAMDRENPLVGNLVAIMLGILRSMTNYHYDTFVRSFSNKYDLQSFIIELLLVFQELVSPHPKPVFPKDWMDMIMHQNTVILGSLQKLSTVIIDAFFEPFEKQVWSNFFQCSIAFLIQSPLQLNDFSDNKRATIFERYQDIRKETANEIRKMWFQLGEHKPQFVPQLVEPILEMSMIPEVELRKATIPIFFDMMQCEYYSSKMLMESYGDTKRNNAHYKANFNEFETEMIEKLDVLIGSGKGDHEFKDLFQKIMLEHCMAHNTLNVEGTRFVNMLTKLMERLLEYRCIIQDESKENRMGCTFSILQFYLEVNRKEMYIRYVYKLCDLHMEFENYTEAAFTLKLHTNLLQWNDTELSPLLRSHRHVMCRTHRELKEALYYEIIDYFNKGKVWECAIDMCKVLAKQYEEVTFDYLKLADLYKTMAQFFEKILKEMRHTSEYFRVGYYGMKFPNIFRNKVFVFRGKEYERLSDFCSRILVQHPTAELMQTLTTPGPEIMQADGQYIQINNVEPIMDEAFSKFNDNVISNEIAKYYTSNNVQKFKFSRPFREKDSGSDDVRGLWLERTVITTSFPLPGILRWFPVVNSEKFKISPIALAVETMESTNKALRDLIIAHRNDENIPINPLSMKINGIVDPAVMGGFGKYEEAFLTPDYLEENPDDEELVDRLKDLIASQIPLLEIAISVHKSKAPESLKLFHERIEKCFSEMQTYVESKYGKKSCDLKFERDSFVLLRRNGSMMQQMFDGSNRLSETSMGSSDSGLSKSTFYGRAQSNSIKSTFASFNFNTNITRTTLGHSPSVKSKTKEKTPTKRRSIKKLDREALSLPVANSQWYTTPLSTITSTPEKDSLSLTSASNTSLSKPSPDPRVLTEELTSKRPLRSEKEKERRLSRPASIATPTSSMKGFSAADTHSLSGGDSSNRNSVDIVDTTDSTSEEDLKPPPLPAKTRDSTDFTSLTGGIDWTQSSSFVTMSPTSIMNSTYEYVEATNPVLTAADDKRRPPTPPPKPSRNSKHIP